MGVCNSGAKAWGGDDGSAGAAGGGDIRVVQGAGNSSNASDFHLVRHDEGPACGFVRDCQRVDLKEKLGVSRQAAFTGVPVKASAQQQQVSDALRGKCLSVEYEFRCPKSGYAIVVRHARKHKGQSFYLTKKAGLFRG